MYLRTTSRKRGDKVYQSLHLVESVRTRQGKVRQKIIVNFGPAHKYSKEQVKGMIDAFKRFFKIEDRTDGTASPDTSRDFGATFTIFRVWDRLGWTAVFEKYLKDRRFDFEVIANLKVLVANRLLDPMAKLHILDWMEGVYFPGIDRSEVDYNHLLRAMDFLIENKMELEPRLASPMLNLFDGALDLVFYDLTSCYFEIDSSDNGNKDCDNKCMSTLRNRGYDRDRSGCPQVVLGLVMTKDGIPLCHYVFPGETQDKSTFQEVISDIKARFPIKRCIVVADRGLLSKPNLEVLADAGLDHIVSRPLRQNKVSREAITAVAKDIKRQIRLWETNRTPLVERECFTEAVVNGRRFVVAHNDEIARQSKSTRKLRMAAATSYIKWRIARTKARLDGSLPATGKVLSHQETLIHLHDYLRDRDLTKFYRVYLDDQGHVDWRPDEESRLWELEIDGKLVLETTNHTLGPEEVVSQYKELQDIERCFRTLKSSLDIRPIYHRTDRRIEAHIFMCVMALQLHRFIRFRLNASKIVKSPERVLEKLSFQRTVEAQVDGRRIKGLTAPTYEQLSFYEALGVAKPQYRDIKEM
jgi:transposase